MGSTLIKGDSGEENEPQTDLNGILKSIGNEVNIILQNQNKNLESIKQSLNEQTNYLKTIADNIIKPSMQFSETKMHTSQKSIQLTLQSSNMSFQKKQSIQSRVQIKSQLQENQCLQQKQKQKNINKINELIPLPQLYLQKRTEIYNRIQKIQLNLKNQLYSQKNNLSAFNEKNSNELKKIGTLNLLDSQEQNRGNIDYKDRFLVMPLVQYNKHQKLNMMGPWISHLYEKLAEEAFYGYFKKDMTKQQMKVFFSQNFILNTVNMIRFLTENNQQISIKQILKKFGKLSGSVLDFQLKKYPQKKKIFVRPQIQNMVQQCQIHEDPQYDILRNMKFHYQYQYNGIYYKQIKLMINKIITLTNEHFKQYQEQMKKIFVLQQQIISKDHIQYKIGRKINQDTPQFNEQQINSNKINIQSPQIMRIIIKWIQELQDKINIQKIEKNIDNRYYPFPLRDGGQVQYSKQILQYISKNFKQYLSKHDQHKSEKNLEMLQNIESQLINYIDTYSKYFTYLSSNNTAIGLTAHLLSETVQEIAIKRLNQILHSILSFQHEDQYRFFKSEYKNLKYEQNFGNVDYVTFSIYDLLRSRCSGNYQKIKLVYAQLKKNTNFKIIRVKNRLATGNRDFLINMRFKNTPIICELQLGLILESSRINQKQDLLGDFNHFLYELKRSKYGPLTEAVMLNAYYSQTITFFQQKLKKIKSDKEKNMKILSIIPKISNGEIYIPDYDIVEQVIMFVCHNCMQIKSTKTSFLNTYNKRKQYKEDQFQYLCGECVLNTLQVSDRNKYLLGEYINQYFQQTNQILENDKVNKYKFAYYLIISNDRRRYFVKKLDKHYFIQSFSSLVSQKYKFLQINQLSLKYVYRLCKQFDNQQGGDQQLDELDEPDEQQDDQQLDEFVEQQDDLQVDDQQDGQQDNQQDDNQQDNNQQVDDSGNIIRIHNIQELIKKKYINQQQKLFLIKNKKNWKQAIFMKGKQGSWRLIDATKEKKGKDYKSNLQLFIKTNQIKKFKEQKKQYFDLGFSGLDQEFFIQNLKEIKQIKKLNLSQNHLTDISQIIQGKKNLLELKLNHNQLQDVDLCSLINLKKLEISHNQIKKIELDKLVKLQQLNLSDNQIKALTLSNKQCRKLNLSNNKLVKLDISKMQKLKELQINNNQFQQLVLENLLLEKLDISQNEKLIQINIQKLMNLQDLTMMDNQFSKLTLRNPKLQFLNLSGNRLIQVNFQALISLKTLILDGNELQYLKLDNPILETLTLVANQLKNINISKLVQLYELVVCYNQLTQFPKIGIKSLQILNLNKNKLKKINLDEYSNLINVNISENQINEFIIGEIALQRLQAEANHISKVDITKLNKIRKINFSKNKIQQIVVKNESLQVIQLQYNRIYNINIDKLHNLKQLNISNNCIKSINITKQNNPKLCRIWLDSKSDYEKYFIQKLLTEQQQVRYNLQKLKSIAEDGQILSKLGFYPTITNEILQKIKQSIYDQFGPKIAIINVEKKQ